MTDNVKKMGEKYTKDIRELNDKVIAIDERTKNIRDIGIGILVALIVGNYSMYYLVEIKGSSIFNNLHPAL